MINHLALVPACITTFLAITLFLKNSPENRNRLLAGVFGITAVTFWNRYFMLHEFTWAIYAPFLLFPLIWLQGPLIFHAYKNLTQPEWVRSFYAIGLLLACVWTAIHTYFLLKFPVFHSLEVIKNQAGMVGVYTAYFMAAVSLFNGSICLHILIKIWRVNTPISNRQTGNALQRFQNMPAHLSFDTAMLGSFLLLYGLYFSGAILSLLSIIKNPIVILDVVFACIVFFLILFLLLHKPEMAGAGRKESEKYARHSLDEKKARLYQQKLLQFMQESKPYLEHDLTLSMLADKLSIPAHHLSIVINRDLKTKFFDFLSEYRIAEARRLLDDPNYSNENLLEICYESGFQSRSAFNKAFKRICGTSPSEYRKSTGTRSDS